MCLSPLYALLPIGVLLVFITILKFEEWRRVSLDSATQQFIFSFDTEEHRCLVIFRNRKWISSELKKINKDRPTRKD